MFDYITKLLGHFESVSGLTISLIVLFTVIIVYNVLKAIIFKEVSNVVSRQHYRKVILYVSIATVFISFMVIWFEPIKNIAIVLSAFAVGFVIGFKELLTCLSGRFLLAVNRSYNLRNRIEINGITGDVIDIGILSTTVVEVGGIVSQYQSSSRIITIPHSLLITHPVKNYTRKCDYIWDELVIKIDQKDDWQEAKHLLLIFCNEVTGHLQEEAEKEMIKLTEEFAYKMPPLQPVVFIEFVDEKIALTLRYLVKLRERRQTRNDIIEKLLPACKIKCITLK